MTGEFHGDPDCEDATYELSYNLRGDMTDVGQNYDYVYDGFGRLRRVLNHAVPEKAARFVYRRRCK